MAKPNGGLPSLGPAVVRWGVGLVFLVFGAWQWIAPATWFGYLPPGLPLDPSLAIYLNGALDATLGVLLVLGLFTRLAALLGALHLATIAATLGWNDVLVRDLGLAVVLIGVALRGEDAWCLDRRMESLRKSKLGRMLYLGVTPSDAP